MKRLYILLLFITSIQINPLEAQTSSGTEFWLAYMENLTLQFNDSPVFAIHISSEFDTQGEIGVPATGFTQAFTVMAGETTEVILPPAIWYSEVSEVVEGKGIRVTADDPVEVAATHFRIFFTEATGVLPATELSNEYLTTCYIEEQPMFPSSFVVVATEDDTEVEITPSVFTSGLHPADIPFTITLNEGEIYQVQALADLTGSRVLAPNGEIIAVFSGAQQARVVATCNGFADNHLWEQSQPFANWSDLYYFVPYKNQGSDLVRILAKDDNTTVYFDCDETTTLQAGEYYDATISNPTVINSTNPIALTQFNESFDCNPSNTGDPNMITHLPTSRQTFRANWRATDGATGSLSDLPLHFTNVIMKTENTASISLDGVNVSDEFSPFSGDATLSYAQLTVTAGNHILTSDEPFHTYHYGFGEYDAYTKTGNFQVIETLEYVCLEIEAEGIFCVDSLINFTANSNFEIATYDWQSSDNQSSNLFEPSFSYSAAGDYTVSLTITTISGQTFTDSYDLTIEECVDEPCDQDAEIVILAEEFCAGVPTQFSFTSTFDFVSVEWNFGDASSTSSEISPAHIYAVGEYEVIFTGIDALNCEYTQQILVEIIDCNGCGNPELEITFTGEVCIGEEITFMSDYNGIPSDLLFINWEFGNGIPSDEISPVVTYQFAGNFIVTLEIIDLTNDCLYNGVVPITIEDCSEPCTNLPDISLSNFSGETQCLGEAGFIFIQTTAQLVDFQWFLNDVLVVEGSDTYAPVVTELGIYTVTLQAVDVDGCEYEALFEFAGVDCEDPCLDYDIGEINVEGEFCVDSLLSFSTSIPDMNSSYLWTLDNGETFVGMDFSTVFSEETAISLSVIGVNEDGCEDEADFTFSIENCESVDDCLFPPNSVEIGLVVDISYCVGDTIQWSFEVDNNINITSVLWQVSDGQTFTNFMPSIPILNDDFVEITLEAIDENGCIYLDTIASNLYRECEENCQIFVPNAFTPNGDMVNETFKPLSGCEPISYSFEIYSRWGELLFQTNDFNAAWDGFHRGKAVPASVYAWVMTYSFSEQNGDTIVGDVTVVR